MELREAIRIALANDLSVDDGGVGIYHANGVFMTEGEPTPYVVTDLDGGDDVYEEFEEVEDALDLFLKEIGRA